MSPHTRENIPNIRYTDAIELKYDQNNLAFELSDLPYSLEEKHEFVYRLEGMDKEWNFLQSNTNRITYSNLGYGDYQLVISKVEKSGSPSEHPYILNIKILPPWYYTLWAKIIYILLFLSLHCLGYQLFPCQEPSKNGTDGKREDSGTITPENGFLYQFV